MIRHKRDVATRLPQKIQPKSPAENVHEIERSLSTNPVAHSLDRLGLINGVSGNCLLLLFMASVWLTFGVGCAGSRTGSGVASGKRQVGGRSGHLHCRLVDLYVQDFFSDLNGIGFFPDRVIHPYVIAVTRLPFTQARCW